VSTFRFSIGQEVSVISQDRGLDGMKVRIISRESDESAKWYLVTGVGIHVRLSFFEDQLR
jgi:hypothetical protein